MADKDDYERAIEAVTWIEQMKSGYPRTPSDMLLAVSKDAMDILDAAVSEIPSDLLVVSQGTMPDFDLTDLDEALSYAAAVEGDESFHSLARYHARLMREHLSEAGRTHLIAFRQAMAAVDAVGLFDGEKVSEIALEVFPSLEARKEELEARRLALSWRPERGEDRVVEL